LCGLFPATGWRMTDAAAQLIVGIAA